MKSDKNVTNQSRRIEDRLQQFKNELITFNHRLNAHITLIGETIDKLHNSEGDSNER